jgi:ornithine cyclodeaminase/alanine dehydrogenase-like protein (mu-crystallin family)
MRFLTDEEVASALSMREVIEAVERSFALYSLRKVRMPQRVRTEVPEHNGTILLMPCQVPELEVYSFSISDSLEPVTILIDLIASLSAIPNSIPT